MTEKVLACRFATSPSAIARLERHRPLTGLDSIDGVAVAVGCDTAIVIEQKRPV
jgi:hypothetical protein